MANFQPLWKWLAFICICAFKEPCFFYFLQIGDCVFFNVKALSMNFWQILNSKVKENFFQVIDLSCDCAWKHTNWRVGTYHSLKIIVLFKILNLAPKNKISQTLNTAKKHRQLWERQKAYSTSSSGLPLTNIILWTNYFLLSPPLFPTPILTPPPPPPPPPPLPKNTHLISLNE